MNRRVGFLLGGAGTVAVAGAISIAVVLASSDSRPASTNDTVATSSESSTVISQIARSLGVSSGSLQSALTQTSPDGEGFIERLAEKLGIDPQVLRDAITATGTDIINKAEANGDISADMAERLRSLLEEGDLFDLDRLGDIAEGFFGKIMGHDGGLFGLRAETFTAVADFLGMSEADLRSGLEDGKSLAAIGEEHGKSREAMKQFLVERATANIDQDLADGEITQEEADELKDGVEGLVDKVLDQSFSPKLFGGIFPGGAPRGFDFGVLPGIFQKFSTGLSEVAEFLGITEQQLKDELNAGKTPAEIAEGNGKTAEEFQSFLQQQASEGIQELQDEGRISEEEAAEWRERANEAIEQFMDASIRIKEFEGGTIEPRGVPWGGPRLPQPEPDDSSSSGNGTIY